MATELQRDMLRFRLAIGPETISNAILDMIFLDATNVWGTNDLAVEAYAGLTIIDNLLAQAVKRVDYTQNESSEKLGQLFSHLNDIRPNWVKKLADAEALASEAAVMYGGLKRYRTKLVEFPSDYSFGFPNGDITRFGH